MINQRTTPFVGRTLELEAVEALLEAALRGEGAFAVVEGEPGIGKTRLLDEAIARAQSLGFQVADGCGEELRRHPFAVLATALGVSDASEEGRRKELARLMHDEARPDVDLSFRITELALALLEDMAAQAPLLVLLDDIQWADPPTLAVAAAIVRRLRGRRVALLAARRPHPASPALDCFVEGLWRAGGSVVRLGPIDDAAVDALAEGMLGGAPGPNLRRQLAGAAGNPLFVRELAAALADSGEVRVRDGRVDVEATGLPPSLQLTILRRLGALGEPELELLRLASVLGTSFSLAELALVSGHHGIELVRLVRAPSRAGFLVEAGDGLRFRHDLVREALYYEMPQAVRAALHLDAARRLAEGGRDPLAVAAHLTLGASRGDEWAVEWLRRAAEQAAPRSPALTAELLERALDVAGPGHPRRVELLARQADPLVWAGRSREAIACAEEALSLSPRPVDEARARLALLRAHLVADLTEDARVHAEAAESKDFPPGIAAQLLAETAWLRLLSGEPRAARAAGERAMALATSACEIAPGALAKAVLASVAFCEQRIAEAVPLAMSAAQSAKEEPGLRQHASEVILALALTEADRLAEAEHVLREGLGWLERTGADALLPSYLDCLTVGAFWSGRWDDALAYFRRWSDVVADDAEFSVGPVRACGAAAVAALRRGDVRHAREATATGRRALCRGPRYPSSFWVVWGEALLLESSGDARGALSLLWERWRNFDAKGLRLHHRLAGPDLVRLALALGERDVASAATEAVGRTALLARTPSAEGAALYCRGLLERDGPLLHAAAEAYRVAGRPLPLAMSLEARGRVAAGTGAPQEAGEALREALDVFERLGAGGDVRRIQALLRDMGVRRTSERAAARPQLGWEALTHSELEVVALIAEGCSNPEVAERLFISRRTVEAHLRGVFRKLGVTSRSQLVAEAVRRLG